MNEMNPQLHGAALCISVGFVLYVFFMVRRNSLQVRDSLIWFFIGAGFIALSLFPMILRYIADLMGIGLGISALFLVSSITALVILFQHSISISKAKEANRKLTQEIALLRAEFEKETGRGKNESSGH